MAEEIKSTTIKIAETTRERIEHLKEHKEESCDTLINKALNILNVCMRSPSFAAKILRDIEKGKKRKEILENPDKFIKKKTAQNISAGNNLHPINSNVLNKTQQSKRTY